MTTDPRIIDADPAFQLLSHLFYIVDLHVPIDVFRNGVTHQSMDEGEVMALRFLGKVRDYLAQHGDSYAGDCFPADDETPF